jgi:hypothetical protein
MNFQPYDFFYRINLNYSLCHLIYQNSFQNNNSKSVLSNYFGYYTMYHVLSDHPLVNVTPVSIEYTLYNSSNPRMHTAPKIEINHKYIYIYIYIYTHTHRRTSQVLGTYCNPTIQVTPKSCTNKPHTLPWSKCIYIPVRSS